ncbi:MAG: hypothetical protein AAF726_06350 [Planctomycetota bacterium]
MRSLTRPIALLSLLVSLAAVQEELRELPPHLRAALEDLRASDPGRAAEIVDALNLDVEMALEQLEQHADFMHRLEEASPELRRLLERDQRYRLAVRDEARSASHANSSNAPEALQQLLDDWFDVRQALRRQELERMQEHLRELGEEREGSERESALDWLAGALLERDEASIEERERDAVELLGAGLERSSPELSLLELEIELLRDLESRGLRAETEDEAFELAEELLRESTSSAMVGLLDRIAALEVELRRMERAHLEQRCREAPRMIARREELRPILVELELLRWTGREEALEW